jgi:malate dehydrogenase (oxaloacetate-decarboxylating)
MDEQLIQAALAAHLQHPGKLATQALEQITPENLALFYTPGVGAVSKHLAANPTELGRYSMQGNAVAVVSDGSAVLGLGNIGPQGAYPVMEGKALLFKALAGVDAVPIVLSTQDPDEIVAAVRAIAPSFAGINLEDIAAPACYQIEERLQDLGIPVMHDDQHATAIVVLTGFINAAKLTGRDLRKSRIAVLGAGAAGSACAKLLCAYGVEEVVVVDSKGIISQSRADLDQHKRRLAESTNPAQLSGDLAAALKGSDMVVGLAQAGLLKPEHIKSMAAQPVVFALSNPVPEIYPADAIAAGAAVVATGRSDFANQINNVLVFPGFFRGALDCGVRQITDEIKLRAAQALADLVTDLKPDNIMPSVFDPRVATTVAQAVAGAANQKPAPVSVRS